MSAIIVDITGRLAQKREADRQTRERTEMLTLYSDCLELVEKVAAYLDTTGRTDFAELAREHQSIYGVETLRLKDRILDLAAFLLVWHAHATGDIGDDDAIARFENMHWRGYLAPAQPGLPDGFRDITLQTERLFSRTAAYKNYPMTIGRSQGQSP